MAGSITLTVAAAAYGITKYSVAWTSDASGNVNGNAIQVLPGRIQQVRYVPGTGGTQPSDLYDLTLPDADGFDVLTGTGANLSQTNVKVSVPLIGDGSSAPMRLFLEAGATLTPIIANAGNAKTGRFDVLIGPG
jgi:hypothetical protein